MTYFKTRIRELQREYKRRDARELIDAAGKCAMCGRKSGDRFLFGPTNYLKKRISFKVSMQVHIVDGAAVGDNRVVLCSGCHMSYHLFWRLSEGAELGNVRLDKGLYKRCTKCRELKGGSGNGCRCCHRCKKAPGKCDHRTRKGRKVARKR